MPVHSRRLLTHQVSLAVGLLLACGGCGSGESGASQAATPPVTPASPLAADETEEAKKVAAWVKSAPVPAREANHFSVIGAMHFLTIGDGAVTAVRTQGAKSMYDSSSLLSGALSELSRRNAALFPVLAAGGLHFIRDVQMVPWGMIEVAPGEYRFELLDAMVRETQAAGLEFVANVMPFADWDQTDNPPADPSCDNLLQTDTYYLTKGGRMGRVKDLDAYTQFVTRVAERYNGDGVNDAPGLLRPVKHWKIFNEPEGEACGGYRSDPAGFVTLMKKSRDAIRSQCPSCVVLNGGAAIPQWRQFRGSTFWAEFAQAGGAEHVDIIAVHYNQAKNAPNEDEDSYLEIQIGTLRSLLGSTKPVWLTEFGALIAEANAPAPPPRDAGGTGPVLTQKTEEEAASWYFRRYVVGLAAGATRFFSDTQSFVQRVPGAQGKEAYKVTHPFWVNQLVESKLGAFTAAKRLADGQYEFTVGGKTVYALWRGIPKTLAGTVTVTDHYGNTSSMTTEGLAPSPSAPIFVEP